MTVTRPYMALGALLCSLTLSACASTTSTSSFKGTQQAAAQTIANLQAAATAGEQKKICTETLAASLVKRLGGTKGCETAIKNQIDEVDNLEVTVQSVTVAAGEKSATAQTKSVDMGKKTVQTLALVKEGGKWKISGL